jgi:hypothetical protein
MIIAQYNGAEYLPDPSRNTFLLQKNGRINNKSWGVDHPMHVDGMHIWVNTGSSDRSGFLYKFKLELVY